MKELTIVIPTYKRDECENPLPRLLDSLKHMKKKNFRVIVLNTTKNPPRIFISKINEIIKKYKKSYPIYQFHFFKLGYLKYIMKNDFISSLNMDSYSGFRNVGLILATLLRSDNVLFLDDDEVAQDKDLTKKAVESIGKPHGNLTLGGVTGYYINEDGSYKVNKEIINHWWDFFWRKIDCMNKAFDKAITGSKRLNDTTVALGGNMVLHHSLFEKVPFDPFIIRGEDSDMVLNSKIFGFEFLMDNHLKINHLPIGRGNQYMLREAREDFKHFYYMRQKMLYLLKSKKINHIPLNIFDPYPGLFIRRIIYLKAPIKALLIVIHAIFHPRYLKESLNVLRVSLFDAFVYSTKNKSSYLTYQKIWENGIKEVKLIAKKKEKDINQVFI